MLLVVMKLELILECLQIMVPNNYKEFIGKVTYLVSTNTIPMSRIDDAVKRILRVKFVMGLFENPIADTSLASKLGCRVRTIYIFLTSPTGFIFLYHECEYILFPSITGA